MKHADGLDEKEMRKDQGEEHPSGGADQGPARAGHEQSVHNRHPFGNLIL